MSDLVLYADYGCPYAHRVLALMALLDVEHTLQLVPHGTPPSPAPKGTQLSRIPLFVAGELVLTESRVINEYLVERFGYADAFPADTEQRARHRYALALVDEYFAPGYVAPLDARGRSYLAASLEVFEAAMTSGPRPSLFALHAATGWRFVSRSARQLTNVVPIFETRPTLVAWLDEVAAHPCIVSTSPDEARLREEVGAVGRRAG